MEHSRAAQPSRTRTCARTIIQATKVGERKGGQHQSTGTKLPRPNVAERAFVDSERGFRGTVSLEPGLGQRSSPDRVGYAQVKACIGSPATNFSTISQMPASSLSESAAHLPSGACAGLAGSSNNGGSSSADDDADAPCKRRPPSTTSLLLTANSPVGTRYKSVTLLVSLRHRQNPVTLSVLRSATTNALYASLKEKVGPAELGSGPVSVQFAGKVLRRGSLLAHYGLQNGSRLMQIGGLRGGMNSSREVVNPIISNRAEEVRDGVAASQVSAVLGGSASRKNRTQGFCTKVREAQIKMQENFVAAGGDVLDVISMAASAGQAFSLAQDAALFQLPTFFVDMTSFMRVFLFDFPQLLQIPSLDLATSELVQNLAIAIFCIFCCWFIVSGVPNREDEEEETDEEESDEEESDEDEKEGEDRRKRLQFWQRAIEPKVNDGSKRSTCGSEKLCIVTISIVMMVVGVLTLRSTKALSTALIGLSSLALFSTAICALGGILFSLLFRTAHTMHRSPVKKGRRNEEMEEADPQMPNKHFRMQATNILVAGCLHFIQLMFVPLSKQAMTGLAAQSQSTSTWIFSISLIICTLSVLVVLGHSISMALRQMSQIEGCITPAEFVEKWSMARTTITYFTSDGSIMQVDTEADICNAKHGAILTLTLPFKAQMRWCMYLPVIFLIEKACLVAVVVFATEGALLRVLLPCIISGPMILFLVLSQAYDNPIKMLLAFSARCATLSVSVVGLIEYIAPGAVSVMVQNIILVTTFAFAALVYCCILNPAAVYRKARHLCAIPGRLHTVVEYSVPADTTTIAEWVEQYDFHKYDTLVMSISQVEHVLSHCSENDKFDAWITFGVAHRRAIATIRELKLVNRNIRSIGDGICRLKKLVSLDLSNNMHLNGLQDSIGRLEKLEKLILNECSALTGGSNRLSVITHSTADVIMSGLPNEIGNLQSLIELNCFNCTSLKSLPKMDGCSSLTELNLQSCKKLAADGLIEFCSHPPPMLQKLNLSYTNLKTLPSTIGKCASLTSLDLRRCGSLEGLPEGVFELPLKSLNIAYCKKLPLDVIDTICQKMPQLESLNLSGLEITGLPSEIGNLQSLTTLNCRFCKSLQTLPKEIGNLQMLQILFLVGCKQLEVDKEKLQAQLPNCKIMF